MKIQTNETLSKKALALSVTPGVVGYTAEQVSAFRSNDNIPTRIRNIKSDALFALSVDVLNTVVTGENAITAQSVLLGKILQNNLFLTEGYDTFKEFAETVYGISGSTAYMRAKVGNAIIGNPNIPDDIKRMPVSTLERVAHLTGEQIETAINDGRLTPDMSQFEVRDMVKAVKAEANSTKPKAKTSIPVIAEIFMNGEWTVLTAKLESVFNAKELPDSLSRIDSTYTGNAVKSPYTPDDGYIELLCENVDNAFYRVRFKKAVQKNAVDKSAKTLTEISMEQMQELLMKVAAGELTMKEVAANFTVAKAE